MKQVHVADVFEASPDGEIIGFVLNRPIPADYQDVNYTPPVHDEKIGLWQGADGLTPRQRRYIHRARVLGMNAIEPTLPVDQL